MEQNSAENNISGARWRDNVTAARSTMVMVIQQGHAFAAKWVELLPK